MQISISWNFVERIARSSSWALGLLALTASPSALSAATFEEAFAVYEEESEAAPAGSAEASEKARSQPEPKATKVRLNGSSKKPSSSARLLVSQFADVPFRGSAPNTLRYGGRADAYINFGGSNLGLDDSFTVSIRPELTWGETSNGEIGLIPNNTALFRGEGAGDFDVSASVTKKWKSGTSLTVGKVNVLDLSGQLPVVGSDGHRGFQNLSTALPPSAIIANTITGAFLSVPTNGALFRLWVYDPDTQFERTGFETRFESGIGFLGSITLPVKIGGQPGYYALKLSGSTRNDINADSLPAVLIPGPGSSFGQERGEFAAVLAAYQYVQTYPEVPGKGWGVFGQVYASKGDPTFLDYSGFIGMSGNPRGRPQDRFGAAWFRYSLTNSLVRELAPRLGLEDEEGVELFYTLGLSKNFELTANAQVIDGAVAARETGVIAGLRLTATF